MLHIVVPPNQRKQELEQCILESGDWVKFSTLLETLNFTEKQPEAVLNSKHNNLLTMAINQKLPQFVQSLLEAGADPQFVDEQRVPPLNRACWNRCTIWNGRSSRKGDTSIPRMLIECGAEVDTLDGNGVTPLYIALLNENNALWKLLFLTYDADPFIICEPQRQIPLVSETCVDLAIRVAVDANNDFSYALSCSCGDFIKEVDRKYSKNYFGSVQLEYLDAQPMGHY